MPAATAKMRLVQVAEDIIQALAADPTTGVTVTVEVAAEFPNGVSPEVQRVVNENAGTLHFRTKDWA